MSRWYGNLGRVLISGMASYHKNPWSVEAAISLFWINISLCKFETRLWEYIIDSRYFTLVYGTVICDCAHCSTNIMIKLRSDLHSRTTPHTSPLRCPWPFASYIKKNDRDISRVHCTQYDGVIMGPMTSQITSLSIVYSIVYSGAD